MTGREQRQLQVPHVNCLSIPRCYEPALGLLDLRLTVGRLDVISAGGDSVRVRTHDPDRVRPHHRQERLGLRGTQNLGTTLPFHHPRDVPGVVGMGVRDHHSVDPLVYGFLDVIRARPGDVCLRLEAGVHQDARVTHLDEQGAAADMVRAAHRGDGQAAGAHLGDDGALWLPVISDHVGPRARVSDRIEAIEIAQQCDEPIQAPGSPNLAALITTIRHAFCTLAQLRGFADGQRHESASAAASVVSQVGF